MADGTDRNSKRSRLGGRAQRAVYRSAHGWKHRWWRTLCLKASRLNDKSSNFKEEARLDKRGQELVNVGLAAAQTSTLAAWRVL